MSFLFGLGKKNASDRVELVSAPVVDFSIDEFADLERELDDFE